MKPVNVGWVGFINPAAEETDKQAPRRWVDGANPAYGPAIFCFMFGFCRVAAGACDLLLPVRPDERFDLLQFLDRRQS